MDPNSPLAIVLGAIGGIAVGLLPALLVFAWLSRRDRRRFQQEEAERQRQQALQRQQWELEEQIWRENLPDWQREAIEAAAHKRVEIRREARRRLGLPEEEPPHDPPAR
jgi:hypothetical protein